MYGGDDVYSRLTLEVERSREPIDGTRLAIRENGGVVRFAEISDSYAAKMTDEERAAHADDLVDFQFESQPHSSVGQEVVLFIGGEVQDKGGQFAAARLVLNESGEYAPLGPPLNPEWTDTYPDPVSAGFFS